MENKYSSLETLIQEKISSDADFQTTLADLSDEEKEQAITEKRKELIEAEFTAKEEAKKKADEIALNQKIRAEKAEQELKKAKPAGDTEPPKKSEGFSLKDIRALNSIHDDDVDFVTNWAKSNNMEIVDAVKHKDVQLVLKGHEEERKSAEASNTGGSRRATSKTTGADLHERAMTKNDIPESEEDMKKLIEARFTPKT